ncbi:MAG: 50S ribosomal protein L4 [Acidimicrobiales bacterium]|jgi:large subunit ribosomal protein L4
MASETIDQERTTTVTVDRHNGKGDVIDTVELDASIFGVVPNIPLMHQVVTAQLAARRRGTHSTKTRSEVSGGGAKPYRQKGTGRARQGTIRAPQFAGGGVAFGPKPRSYAQRTPRKMVRLALHSALSDRVNEGKLRILDEWPFEIPKTKDAVKVLKALELDGRILVVLSTEDAIAERSFGNLPDVHLVEAAQLSAYEVLANDWILFTSATVPGGVTVVEGSARPAVDHSADDAGADGDDAGPASGGETSAGDDSSADDGTTDADDVTETSDESVDEASESAAVEASDDSSDEAEDDVSAEEASDEAEAEVSPLEASTVDDLSDDEAEDNEDEEESE